jgi:A/G-specific adenine glycosylase
LFESVVHAYPEKKVRLEFFLCRWLAVEPQPLGCADLQWVTRNEFGQFKFPAADARLIDRLHQSSELWEPGDLR